MNCSDLILIDDLAFTLIFGGSGCALKLRLIGQAVMKLFGPFVTIFNFTCSSLKVRERKRSRREEEVSHK